MFAFLSRDPSSDWIKWFDYFYCQYWLVLVSLNISISCIIKFDCSNFICQSKYQNLSNFIKSFQITWPSTTLHPSFRKNVIYWPLFKKIIMMIRLWPLTKMTSLCPLIKKKRRVMPPPLYDPIYRYILRS